MESRDSQNWAKTVDTLDTGTLPEGAHNINVQGKRVLGPVHGFGQLWQKVYRMKFEGVRVPPEKVIAAWKEHFPKFWPKVNTMYKASAGIKPGDVGVINSNLPGNVTFMSTGIYVIYADDISFSFMTPEGHPWAGMVTFGAEEEDDATIATVQVLVRANDPLYELGMRTFMSKAEDWMWFSTLKNVADHFGATGKPTLKAAIVDPKVQWSEWKNVWQNAGIRTALYVLATPVRWLRGLGNR